MCKLDDIIERCRKGDRRAGEQLYKMFSPRMFAVCLQYSSSREEAEDNLQDGFIKVLESIGQYAGKGSFEGWMKRIFVNTALEKYRRGRIEEPIEELPDVADEEEEEGWYPQNQMMRSQRTSTPLILAVSFKYKMKMPITGKPDVRSPSVVFLLYPTRNHLLATALPPSYPTTSDV